ncbi:hypothetical protein [Streptomyces sp. Da 82-17]|uniref:hypothetical protein n=1 Tax=Streptomyces sp. Da 82-17 TaxID=3377116 RepID=UPI0038D41D4C
MSKGPRVDSAVLRSSAHDCDGIADEMKKPSATATEESSTAASSLAGWSVGQALQTIATSWEPALEGLRRRTQAGAENLRASADGHDWNEKRIEQDFEKAGADMAPQAAYGELPPSMRNLRPPPSNGHAPGPPTKSAEEMTDPRQSYGTNMPTYDDSIRTQPHPSPSLGDFG